MATWVVNGNVVAFEMALNVIRSIGVSGKTRPNNDPGPNSMSVYRTLDLEDHLPAKSGTMLANQIYCTTTFYLVYSIRNTSGVNVQGP